ncbi:MAG TPA: hypothetical protein VG295_15360 [Solirubrobacteraceae bacterium]|nr:hypothetical protein [Solirubrobacteraceae bacterium]
MLGLWKAAIRGRAQDESAFTMIELVVAMFVLIVGIMGMFMGFISSQRASLVAERETSMVHIAQQQIEYVQGIPYSQVGMSAAPTTSTDSTNPDYYVSSGANPTFQWNRTAGTAESLDIDTSTPGVVLPVQNWSEGRFSGQIYDFVTWTTDPNCSPACPATQDYKRITVAVTMQTSGAQPHAVYVSSVIADPPAAGGNPLTSPGTSCTNAAGVSSPCTSLIDSGNPNTYYLHDSPATSSTAVAPSSDHATHSTVATASGGTCTTSITSALTLANITGCPTPDLMDNTPPAASDTTLYHYSTDQLANGAYSGGRILQPLCSSGACTGSTGGGSGATTDCDGNSAFSGLLNVQAGFWVSSPVTATTTLTGDGGLSLFSQTVGGAQAVVSFCVEIYDIPPSSGPSGTLGDILAWPPVALGGAGYVAQTDPATGGNWPTSANQIAYIFNFRGSNGTVDIATGDRIGVRVWFKANSNTALDLLYDNPLYPTELQLNTQ